MKLRTARVNREAVGMSPATPWIFVAPATLLVVATILTPILMSGWISLHSWSMLTPLTAMQWGGLDNYATIFRDASFMRALTNTAVFAGAFVVIAVPLALVMAVLITRSRARGARVVLALLFTTYVIPTVAVALLWGYLLSPRGGPVNELFKLVGLPIQPWLGSPRTALWSLVLLTIWQYLGYFTTLLVAGLTQIPGDLYEASELDGAGPVRKLWSITVPLLKRPLTFATAICLINSLGVFDAVAVLTRGGPSDSTNVVTFHAVRTAFDYGQAGRAAAMTMVLLVAVVIAVGGLLLYSRDMDDVP